MSISDDTRTWPELAIGLYDKLTGRDAEITYEFQNMTVGVPSSAGVPTLCRTRSRSGRWAVSPRGGRWRIRVLSWRCSQSVRSPT